MHKSSTVNGFVRKRIRKLRLDRGIKLVELASRANIPTSSYASMETGQCRISLDRLFTIIGALEIEITDVWPFEAFLPGGQHRFFIKRTLVYLTRAEGGALFGLKLGRCKVILDSHISDFLLDRVVLYLENGREYPHGLWFEKKADSAVNLFLKGDRCPAFVRQLIERYLMEWLDLWNQDEIGESRTSAIPVSGPAPALLRKGSEDLFQHRRLGL